MNTWKVIAISSSALSMALLGNQVRVAHADAQPYMEAGAQYLNATENVLEKATGDKGGHRVAALKLVRDAQREVKEGIKWDNEHQSKEERKK
jgi:hypothetical protein